MLDILYVFTVMQCQCSPPFTCPPLLSMHSSQTRRMLCTILTSKAPYCTHQRYMNTPRTCIWKRFKSSATTNIIVRHLQIIWSTRAYIRMFWVLTFIHTKCSFGYFEYWQPFIQNMASSPMTKSRWKFSFRVVQSTTFRSSTVFEYHVVVAMVLVDTGIFG